MTRNDTTQVSVRLPAKLVEVIDSTARDECRTRSAQIQILLQTSVERPRAPVAQRDW